MNDETVLIITGAASVTAAYIAYVITTHGDGIALAAICSAITGIIFHYRAKRKYKPAVSK